MTRLRALDPIPVLRMMCTGSMGIPGLYIYWATLGCDNIIYIYIYIYILAKMSFDKIFDLTAGVYFHFL